jgi:hypothetical protein
VGGFGLAGIQQLELRFEVAMPITPPGFDLCLMPGIDARCRVYRRSSAEEHLPLPSTVHDIRDEPLFRC